MIVIKRKAQNVTRSPQTTVEAHGVDECRDTVANVQNAQKRQIEPFRAFDGTRDYLAMYRAVCNFHKKHSPPRLDDAETYWTETAADADEMVQQFKEDPFLNGMLLTVYEELEREYEARKKLSEKTY